MKFFEVLSLLVLATSRLATAEDSSDFRLHLQPLPANLDRAAILGLQRPSSTHITSPSPVANLEHSHGHEHAHIHPEPKVPSRCGATVDQARERNCSYDPLSVQWLPADCSVEQASEFEDYSRPYGGWRYYGDKSVQEPIVDLSLKTDVGGYWTTRREHMAHCAFMLIRLVEGLEEQSKGDWSKGKLDSMTARAGHSKHCIMTLLNYTMEADDADLATVQTWGRVLFGDCQ